MQHPPRPSSTCRLNNILLNNQWINKNLKEIKKCLETHKNGNTMFQNLWDTEKAAPRGRRVYSDTDLQQETRNFQINDLTLRLKEVGKKE